MSKRKRVVLSLCDKVNIIQCLKKGDSGRMLADKYGVGTSTISDIKKNSETILKFTCALESEDGNPKRKVMKKPQNELLEDAVFTWFVQKRASGQQVSGPLLCEKALEFNKKLDGDTSFKASPGWLGNFKSRHGIHDLKIQGEKISAYVPSADILTDNLKLILQESKYDLEFVYNADETGLYWRSLPTKSLASQCESTSPDCKVSKDWITIMVCANASGTHRMPLFLIGRSKIPKCFKNIKIPLIYTHEKNAWMNTEIFVDWYDNTFIPEVKNFQKDIGKEGKVLLLVDNAPSHLTVELLERENGMFTVKFFPSNVSSILQPMNEGIVQTLKRVYRKHLLCQLLSQDTSDTETVLTLFRRLNLKDCCYMLVEAWNSLQRKTLTRAWNRVLKLPHEVTSYEELDEEIKTITESMKICEGCDAENVKEWLNCDIKDAGFQILTNEQIIEEVKCKDEEEMEDENEEMEKCSVPSHTEAFQALETAFSWFERQKESDPSQLLHLKQIRDLAALRQKQNC